MAETKKKSVAKKKAETTSSPAQEVVADRELSSFGELFLGSLDIFKKVWVKFLWLFLIQYALIFAFVAVAFGSAFATTMLTTGNTNVDMEAAGGTFGVAAVVGFLLFIPLAIALQVAIYKLVYGTAEGAEESIPELLKYGFVNIAGIFGVAFLVGISIIGGTLLFIVPGIIVALMFSAYYPVYVLEGVRGVAVLKRSAALTKGFKWNLFGKYLLAMFVYVGISILVEIVGQLFAKVPAVGPGLPNVLSQLLGFVASPMLVAFGYLLYKDMVAKK